MAFILNRYVKARFYSAPIVASNNALPPVGEEWKLVQNWQRLFQTIFCTSSFHGGCRQFMPGGHSVTEPPESIPNSEVKRNSGDGSVGSPHVRVAHRQAPNMKKGYPSG